MTLGQLIEHDWMDYSLLAGKCFFFFVDEQNICSTLAHNWLQSATYSLWWTLYY